MLKKTTAGRPPINEAADPETYKRFQAVLSLSAHRSLRQWALVAQVDYRHMLAYSKGAWLPPLPKALAIARAAGVTVETLWGHLPPE